MADLKWCIVRVEADRSLTRLRDAWDTREDAQDFLDSLQSNRRNGTEHLARCFADEGESACAACASDAVRESYDAAWRSASAVVA